LTPILPIFPKIADESNKNVPGKNIPNKVIPESQLASAVNSNQK